MFIVCFVFSGFHPGSFPFEDGSMPHAIKPINQRVEVSHWAQHKALRISMLFFHSFLKEGRTDFSLSYPFSREVPVHEVHSNPTLHVRKVLSS